MVTSCAHGTNGDRVQQGHIPSQGGPPIRSRRPDARDTNKMAKITSTLTIQAF